MFFKVKINKTIQLLIFDIYHYAHRFKRVASKNKLLNNIFLNDILIILIFQNVYNIEVKF